MQGGRLETVSRFVVFVSFDYFSVKKSTGIVCVMTRGHFRCMYMLFKVTVSQQKDFNHVNIRIVKTSDIK